MTDTFSTDSLVLALNTEGGVVPDWIELLPPGPVIKGRDGRVWRLNDPETVVAHFRVNGTPLLLDYEHATEVAAPKGEAAPASGWCVDMEVRDGAVWGRVEWTARASNHIATREYRYISPVFSYDRSGLIRFLDSAALTNTPNLTLKALNRETIPEVKTMSSAIAVALGLALTATEAEIVTAITNQREQLAKALNRSQEPPLDKFVPRADYDAALLRATNAETRLTERDAETLAEQAELAINTALEERKIAPSQVTYYKARCKTQKDLEEFKNFVASSPAIVADAVAPPGDGAPKTAALSELEKATCRRLGLTEEEFLKSKGDE